MMPGRGRVAVVGAGVEHALGWRLPGDARVRVDHAARPQAADGLPFAVPVTDDVYIALAHSGITLAPLRGEPIARDVLGDSDARLAPFRP